ncbi:MAG: sulfatase [bacterium]
MIILLITIDCLRHDYILNSNSYTPTISRLSDNSHIFKNAYATGNRTPFSFPSLLGSYYRISQPNNKFDVRRPSIANIFQNEGYKTIGIQAANPYLTSYFNYNVGFNKFYDFISDSNIYKKSFDSPFLNGKKQNIITKFISYSKAIFLNKLPGVDSYKIVSFAIERLKSLKKSENIFMWLHFMDTHGTLKPPKSFHPDDSSLRYWRDIIKAKRIYMNKENIHQKKKDLNIKDLEIVKKLYLACVNYIDYNLNILFSWLKDEGWYDDAIIILTSDHGDAFMEHDSFEHAAANIYNELIKVPLIIKLSNQKNKKIYLKNISHIDLFPSILNHLNIHIPNDFQGKENLFNSESDHYPVFSCGRSKSIPWKISCIYKNWKLITDHSAENPKASHLFNLKIDPNEKKNYLKKEKKKVSELLKYNLEFYENFRSKDAIEEKIDDKEIKKRLISLGYIDSK